MSSRWNRRRFLQTSLAGAISVGAGSRFARSSAAAAREVPWLDEVQSCDHDHQDAPALAPLLIDRNGNPIESVAAWQQRREELIAAWNKIIRPLDVSLAPPTLRVLSEESLADCTRQLVEYEVEPGLMVEAYLLRPARPRAERMPGVACFHSTSSLTIRQPSGVQGDPEDFFGLELARRGWVALCPRNFLWEREGVPAGTEPTFDRAHYLMQVAELKRRHPDTTGMAKMLHDARRALDVLASLPEVDGQRLGAVGHSLGAKEALYLAAFDDRTKVAVSSEGGVGLRMTNWHDPWYLGPQINEPGFAREHHELLAMAAPRAVLVLGGDSADGRKTCPFIRSALDVYRLHSHHPRLGLFNHGAGHSVPLAAQERLYEWFECYGA